MKKVLFATSALVASASMAYADGHAGGVTLSGGGRFGIEYNEQAGDVAGGSSTKIERRMTINIDGSGSTDGGLEFGGRIRLRSQEGDATLPVSSANVWMGNDTFRITVGNADGAMMQRLNYYAHGNVGLTGIGWQNLSFNIGSFGSGASFYVNSFSSRGNTGDVVRLDFNVGGFGVSLSTDSTGDHLSNGSEDAIAANYNFGDWTVAAGYADDAATIGGVARDLVSASVVGSIGDFGVSLAYSDLEDIGGKVVLSGSYDFGDTSITGFVGNTDFDSAASQALVGATEDTVYGIGFTHSLGGAVLAGGVSKSFNDNTRADLGVRFNF
ncbi:porin [Amylibacter sp. IMCC11727]|uniref:porin n=1 Tax=Amylibacter sp. IMCC11727 TaxID=3039851 RepID=UPI00244DD95B|nr:porin [Amylibacter sp. IMCC11727]WGI22226.1 porin [Amylibacter sp. IMCC11727]